MRKTLGLWLLICCCLLSQPAMGEDETAETEETESRDSGLVPLPALFYMPETGVV